MPKYPPLTRQLTQRHEALYPRVQILARQVELIATRRPTAAVSAATRALAEGVLFDLQPFTGNKRGVPVAAADMAGLATQLGQALAALDAYEAAHICWSHDQSCFAWDLRNDPVPVKRLRQAIETPPDRMSQRESESIRLKLIARIGAKASEAYDRGYADAANGRPNAEENRANPGR